MTQNSDQAPAKPATEAPNRVSRRTVEILLVGGLFVTTAMWWSALAWGAYELYEAVL